MITWLMISQVLVLWRTLRSLNELYPQQAKDNELAAQIASVLIVATIVVPALYVFGWIFLPAWDVGPNLLCGRS